MTKSLSRIITSFLIIFTLIFTAIPFASASTLLDGSKTVSFTMNCNKPGYTFNVYKVATLSSSNSSPYETKYTSLISNATNPAVTAAIKNGNTADLLSSLDSIEKMPSSAVEVGTFGPTSETVTTKTLSNLQQGIYYVRAVNYPAGVQSVTNSVFALPYYPDNETGWTYELDDIELAAKVIDKDIETHKSITNSTKNNENFTDVSLGDTVDFEIRSTVTGSTSMKLNSYLVTDDMSKGLTLNKNSFNVALLKKDGSLITNLSNTEYTVTYDTGYDGTDINKNTKFTVAITKDYLQQNEFYGSDVFYTSITYSAALNKNAVVGTQGNPNTEGKIEYSNKNGVTVTHEGNTVYVYTYAITSNKIDPDNKPLEGGEFAIYKSEANAISGTNAIATGVSGKDGIVKYYNSKNEEMKFASGTYYARETKAPKGYQLYANVITVKIDAEYGTVLTNGTYVTNAPENGTATFECTNYPVTLPQTGGNGAMALYIIAGTLLASAAITFGIAVYMRKKAKK